MPTLAHFSPAKLSSELSNSRISSKMWCTSISLPKPWAKAIHVVQRPTSSICRPLGLYIFDNPLNPDVTQVSVFYAQDKRTPIIFCLASKIFGHEFGWASHKASLEVGSAQENCSRFSLTKFWGLFLNSCFQGTFSSCQHWRARGWGQKENSTSGNTLHWPGQHFSSAKVFRKLLYECTGTDGQGLY